MRAVSGVPAPPPPALLPRRYRVADWSWGLRRVAGAIAIPHGALVGGRGTSAKRTGARAPFPAGDWQTLRIPADGETTAVKVPGRGTPPGRTDEPILTVTCPDRSAVHHIALYN